MNTATHKLSILMTLMLAFVSRATFAQSASSYKPLTSADAQYLQHTGYAVYNTDTHGAHSVTADYQVVAVSGSTTWSFTASGYNSGGTFTCTAYAILLSGSFPTTTGTPQSNVSTGGFQISGFSVTVSSAGTYAVSTVCSLPASVGTRNATLFGVSP
jgi:hypothetical protein